VAVLKLVSSVKRWEFMNAIGAKPFAPKVMAELEKYVERQPALASLGTEPPWRHLFEKSGSADPGVFERQIVATRLRMYVDEWIDTGVTARGEVPLNGTRRPSSLAVAGPSRPGTMGGARAAALLEMRALEKLNGSQRDGS